MRQNSSVSKVTDYKVGDRGSILGMKKNFVLPLHTRKYKSTQQVTGVRRPEREADHTSPSIVEIQTKMAVDWL